MSEIKLGEKVLVTVEAEIVQIERGHGICYKVELPQKDFISSRMVWLNPEEMQSIEKIGE